MNARDFALYLLDHLALPEWPPDSFEDLRRLREVPDLRDRELAARINTATIKNLLQINYLIAHFANRRLNKIDPRVRKIMGIALAQILFLDRIPPSAAVDEAVKQARRFGRTSASGFVNAVLRRATREPLPALPEPDPDPREHARLALSHPPELFDRLVNLLGIDDAIQFCHHDNRRPPTIVRLIDPSRSAELAADGVTITPHEAAGMFVVHPTPHDVLQRWSEQGIAQAQDPTSAAVVDACDIQPGQIVLDRCCGLGTKSMQLCERVGVTGSVIAMDRDKAKIRILQSLIEEGGIKRIVPIVADRLSELPKHLPNRLHRVLIDAPCSNSGVLARRSAARYFQDEQTLASLEKLQMEILTDTAPAVAVGGLLIYSTCSVWPEENEKLVSRFLETSPGFAMLRDRRTLPSFETDDPAHYHDGGYVAVLRRRA